MNRKEQELFELKSRAWIGDAVLSLFARQYVLNERRACDGEWFTLMTSNEFLCSFGQPTHVEADVGKIYLEQGLEAANQWLEENLIPVFLKQIAKKKKNH